MTAKYHNAILALLFCAFVSQAPAQCVKQPPVALKGVEEFGCRGMTYEQAWDTLVAGGVAPVRPIRVAEMSMKTNYGSRKQTLSRGLKILGFATSIVAAYFSANLQGWQIGALAAGPAVVDQGLQWVAGAPEEFTQLPDDTGFTTIYALASNQQIVKADAAPTLPNAVAKPADAVPTPQFTPAHWSVLLAETARERHEAIEQWRVADLAWTAEYRRWEMEQRLEMNEAERESLDLIESYQMVAAK